MKGYKDTIKSEVFSVILRGGMDGLLQKKRAGQSIVRIPAQEEKEL